jgi:hypothetical protein
MAALLPELFSPISDPQKTRAMFKACVERVMVETSSYCNRRCSYCPTALVDRFTKRDYMPDSMRDKIAAELAEIDYEKTIVLHFYNEPLADERICEHIALFARACPKAKVELFSNGDYLDAEYLQRLADAGLKSLWISMHLGNNVEWKDELIIRRLCQLAMRLGVLPDVSIFWSNMVLQAVLPHPTIEIKISHKNFPRFGGSDRAGSVSNIVINDTTKEAGFTCFIPFSELYVSWNGTVVPCCDIHPELDMHSDYRIGGINDFPDIFAAFASEKLVQWRTSLADRGGYRKPCDTCQTKIRNPTLRDQVGNFYQAVSNLERQAARSAVA